MTEQRWNRGREVWAAQHDLFRPVEWGVQPIESDREAGDFVRAHHYSGSFPAARFRVGLYRKVGFLQSYLAGVAVFSVPVQPASLLHHVGTMDATELGRLVLLDEVGFNGESWFMARAFRLLKKHLPVAGVLSYSDPLPRSTADGRTVTPGHVGQVYQALNAAYVGRGAARRLYLDPQGRTVAERGLVKIRKQERGWQPAAARLIAAGCAARNTGEEPAEWLARVLPTLRSVRHPGNHAYVWRFDGVKVPTGVYPKKTDSGPVVPQD